MSAIERDAGWRPCVPTRHQLAEGARWFAGGLLYVDLLRGALYRCRGAADAAPEHLLDLGFPLGAVAPVRDAGWKWVLAAGDGIALWPSRGRGPEWLARPEQRTDLAMRMNDGACDAAGRFWAGSMEVGAAAGAGSLYRTDPDGSVNRVLDGLTVPNGPAFSADGTLMYLADSARGTITRHTVDPATGGLGLGEPFVRLAPHEGRPDGMTVDDDGKLWVALWGSGRIRCYDRDGCVRRTVAVPTAHASSVAFGGGLMFVTTARHKLSRPGPLAGAVLARASSVSAPAARGFGRTSLGQGRSLT
ncbi:SMP-30/gluconolactonase/LRE family protein [Streptomyces sp. NPDC029004]|uniref:SMP-30/gluconolactonase/LRE family protein n=1 Tax=Streptomyces sp. NPDC029004 TaxID=3154490 RepID=UPI0033CAD162